MNECPQNWKPSDTAFVFDIDVVVVVAVVVPLIFFGSNKWHSSNNMLCIQNRL